ncbi:diacylglycerol/lipid kinase family protein [Natronomonas amylolytica]|uniref:diacylglycerol/lipid kinase family protein n=1 Tax=Natronomonas amylolytica TaxID=3108498 RepID=UPI003009B647
MKPARVGAVVNPHAGSGNAAELFAELSTCFPDAEVDARITTGPDDVPVAAREQARWGDLVVAIGGDGTLREVAAALVEADADTPLFVVPAGRGNSSYRHLYGDDDWQAVARGLSDGIDRRPLEVGRIEATPGIEPTYFVLGFTAGLFRSALDHAERLRMLPGPVAYVLATAGAALVDDPVEASVDVDGESLHDGPARLVAVGGGRYRGSDFALLPESRPGDGTLHALVVEPADLGGSLRLGLLARQGRLLDHPAVSYATGEQATLRSDAGLPVEMDGTAVPTPLSRATATVVPDALSVAYPTGWR